MVADFDLWEGDLITFDYVVIINEGDGRERIDAVSLKTPASIGEKVVAHDCDGEWRVFDIIHYPKYSVLYVKSPD